MMSKTAVRHSFSESGKKLTKELGEQFEEAGKLEKEIRKNLKGLGYEIK